MIIQDLTPIFATPIFRTVSPSWGCHMGVNTATIGT